MNYQIKKVTLKFAAFAALFGLMCFFMDMMEETEEQTTYSITLENLASANVETNGETQEPPTCTAGGCNASSCSYSGTITVMGSGVQVSNSVSCQDTWACCHVTAYCFSKDDCK